jgi:hypothetical protein
VVKTGGGSKREGLGRGIHWHIENKVLYQPSDSEHQEIPYVRVVEDDGSKKGFVDVEANIDPTKVNEADLVEMDCITCHNRVTHMFFSPEDTVDGLIQRNLIASDIPDIRRQAVAAYSQIYDTTEKGLVGIEGISTYYQTYYGDYYAANQAKIEAAIQALKEAYQNSVYAAGMQSLSLDPGGKHPK